MAWISGPNNQKPQMKYHPYHRGPGKEQVDVDAWHAFYHNIGQY